MVDISDSDVRHMVDFVQGLNLDSGAALGDEFGYDDPVLICLDAVLSIQRRYEQFVVPRIERFQQEFPHVRSLSALKQLIESYGHRRFGDEVWDNRYPPRIQTLELLVNWFLAYQQKHGFADDLDAMRHWAQQPYQEPLSAYGVRGIGIATTQYLRMLAGANTTKPDRHIRRDIKDALGRWVEDEEAIFLIEAVAQRLDMRATNLDHAIWKLYSGDQVGQQATSRVSPPAREETMPAIKPVERIDAMDVQYVVDSDGKRTAVILPMEQYKRLLENSTTSP